MDTLTLQIFETSESMYLASIGHREKTSTFMLQFEVLIGKLLPSPSPRMWDALCGDPLVEENKEIQRIHPNSKRPASIK